MLIRRRFTAVRAAMSTFGFRRTMLLLPAAVVEFHLDEVAICRLVLNDGGAAGSDSPIESASQHRDARAIGLRSRGIWLDCGHCIT